MDQHEIADARRHLQPEPGRPPPSPSAATPALWATARSMWPRSPSAATPAAIAGDETLNGPRMRLSASTIVRRRVAPADAEAGEAVDLREGARHHHVVGGRRQLDAALVVVAPHVLGIGRVEDEEDVGRQPGMQPPHLVERDVGAGRVVGVGDEDDARLRRHPRQDRVDVGGEVLLRRDDRRAARRRGWRSG